MPYKDKDKQREYSRNYSKKNRIRLIKNEKDRRQKLHTKAEAFKKECILCGFNDIRALEFHHVRDKKLFDISRGVNSRYSWEEIEKEIKKCDVLCSNCHAIETWNKRFESANG